MNWRPDNWGEIKSEFTAYGTRYAVAFESHDYQEAFEAGVDAMLAVLRERGILIQEGNYAEVSHDWFTDGTVRIPRAKAEFLGRGWLIFIPDEEEEDE